MGAYQVRADVKKNRLYLKLDGFLADAEAKLAADTIIEEVKKLYPSFDAINDISTFLPVSPAATAEMERAQRFIKDRGVRHVIRVQAGLPLSGMQLARKAKEVGYAAQVVSSVEEAEQLLDQQ